MRTLLQISLSAFLLLSAFAAPAAAQFRLPAGTRVMTDDELAYFFSNRSWTREKSVGYFSEEDSEYIAASNKGGKGRGHWSLPGSGRLCINAQWTWGEGQSPTTILECYAHRTDGIRVFQRREPFGAWHIFKDAPPNEWQKADRLVPGNSFEAPVNLLN